MFFRKHPSVRDGLLSIALVISWSIGTDALCKPPEGTICDFSWYLLRTVTWPSRAVLGKLLDLVVKVTGIVPAPPGVETTHRGMDFMFTSIGIVVSLLYLFLLGGIGCMLWRFVRGRIQSAFGKYGSPS